MVHAAVPVLCFLGVLLEVTAAESMETILPGASSFAFNQLWRPDEQNGTALLPHSTMTLAQIEGPGIIDDVHCTLVGTGDRGEMLQGVFFRVSYNNATFASVDAPVAEFFADANGMAAEHEGSMFAKRPKNSWYARVRMPFEESVQIELCNTTPQEVNGYCYVRGETHEHWDPSRGYFHTEWRALEASLPHQTVPLVAIPATTRGQVVGVHMAVVSTDPTLAAASHASGAPIGICEGNWNFYVGNHTEVAANSSDPHLVAFLGSEDFFGFSWSWSQLWTADERSGTTLLELTPNVTAFATYRFLEHRPIRFKEGLWAEINYNYEYDRIPAPCYVHGCKVTFSTLIHYYADRPLPANERSKQR